MKWFITFHNPCVHVFVVSFFLDQFIENVLLVVPCVVFWKEAKKPRRDHSWSWSRNPIPNTLRFLRNDTLWIYTFFSNTTTTIVLFEFLSRKLMVFSWIAQMLWVRWAIWNPTLIKLCTFHFLLLSYLIVCGKHFWCFHIVWVPAFNHQNQAE